MKKDYEKIITDMYPDIKLSEKQMSELTQAIMDAEEDDKNESEESELESEPINSKKLLDDFAKTMKKVGSCGVG